MFEPEFNYMYIWQRRPDRVLLYVYRTQIESIVFFNQKKLFTVMKRSIEIFVYMENHANIILGEDVRGGG
jgi:hypothetical protein